uniref:Uncharacterized protein n=1 Tax=Solanum lycopersicum TaxID=4081 RepID=A0A3Q7I473_SOLLC
MVFNDQRVTEYFNLNIWVCVSDDFNVKSKVTGCHGHGSPSEKLQELFNGKRYFLVLDDVWNEDHENWANVRAVLMIGESGVSILVTTPLLFKQRAFVHQTETSPKHMEIRKDILKKCGGFPLAAKTLGGFLRFKREENENSFLPALRLSYHHHPLDLRQCFAYRAVFSGYTKIEKEYLITLWMAHNFLLSKGHMMIEDVGNEIEVNSRKTYFNMHDLIHYLATSMFSASASRSIRKINVKDDEDMIFIVTDYKDMMSICFYELFSSYSLSLFNSFVSLRVPNLSNSEFKQLSSSVGDLVHLSYLDLSGNKICSLPKRLCKLQNLQTLGLYNCQSHSCLPKQINKLGSLRIIYLITTLSYFVVGERKYYQLGELRNLHLHGATDYKDIMSIVVSSYSPSLFNRFVSLRVLNLSDSEFEELSSSIGHLSSKEAVQASKSAALDLYNCQSLSCLPIKITKLGSRRNLVLDNCPLTSMPQRIGLLTCVKTLSYFLVGERKGYQLVLNNVVSIIIHGCENCSWLPPFGELPCLESLDLQDGSMEVEYVEDSGFSTRRRFPSLK